MNESDSIVDEPILCFECGEPIHAIVERGVAVTEGIVLCERCCEQHEPERHFIAFERFA